MAQIVKNPPVMGSVPELRRSPGEWKEYPLQYSGLENSTDCIVHGVTKSWTRLSDLHFHSHRGWKSQVKGWQGPGTWLRLRFPAPGQGPFHSGDQGPEQPSGLGRLSPPQVPKLGSHLSGRRFPASQVSVWKFFSAGDLFPALPSITPLVFSWVPVFSFLFICTTLLVGFLVP